MGPWTNGSCSHTIMLIEWHTMLSSFSLFGAAGLLESFSITADTIKLIEGLSIYFCLPPTPHTHTHWPSCLADMFGSKTTCGSGSLKGFASRWQKNWFKIRFGYLSLLEKLIQSNPIEHFLLNQMHIQYLTHFRINKASSTVRWIILPLYEFRTLFSCIHCI